MSQRLAQADPSNAGWQRDVSYSLTLLAELYDETGKQAKALEFAQKSLAISERLALLDRSNATSKEYADLIRALVARLGG